jgi:hypothetical protein
MKTDLIKTSLTPVLTFLLFLCISCNPKPANLIQNPGFETGEGANPEGWKRLSRGEKTNFNAGTDKSDFHSGNASYRISRIWSWTSEPGISTADPVPLDPQKRYLLSFWFKTGGIDEYPQALHSRFVVRSATTPPVTYRKKIYNSDEWQQQFILLDRMPEDALNVSIEFNTDIMTKGSIWLDDISFTEAKNEDVEMFEKWRRQTIPSVTGKAGSKKFEATGFYRVEKGDDRWWYVDPDGDPVWLTATDGRCPVPGPAYPATMTEWFKNNYGTNIEDVAEKFYDIFIEECGFNAFSGGTVDLFANITEKRYEAKQFHLPMTKQLRLTLVSTDSSLCVKDRDGRLLNKGIHFMPDPYNPEWRRLARERAESMIPAYRDKPWFTGWFVSNEVDYDDLYRYIWADYSSLEFIKALKSKYGTIEKLNLKWTSSSAEYKYSSFEDILKDKPEPKDWDDPIWPDFVSFERQMIGELIDFTYDLVKKLDPNHLVISNRLNLDPMPHLYRNIDLWGKYDVVCMNIYPENNKIGFDPGEIEVMKRLHQGTGRPILIGEWSVPAIDSKLYEFGADSLGRPLDWSWPQVMRTQKERGEAYEICIKQLASLDFMIGAHWFRTHDVDTVNRRSNRGLMNGSYKLYQELTDAMKKSHADIKRDMELKW